jgi:nitroimidazol reductase NimA-like FMN-containing flavoprotein (pyridoxamine 5'-phosphate oxidase superfamily)
MANAGGSRTPRALTEAEIERLIARNFWGVLAMSLQDEPYAVPVIYGFDGAHFVFANAPGRKVATLEQNPRVSLVITEVEEHGKAWRSVVAKGSVEWLHDAATRESAFESLRRQIGSAGARAREQSALDRARLARLIPTALTGRAVDGG